MATKKRTDKTPTGPTGSDDDTCECRSGPIFGTARVDGATFRGKWLHYAEVDGQAMFEGDIVLGSIEDIVADDGGNPVLMSIGISAGNNNQFRWPGGRIPYEIDPALPNQARVTGAIAHWEANTGIRFVQRTAANAAQFPDFVRFVPGNGCSSNVGRRGGQQNITLGTSCTLGNAIHEIGHTVGLWHEQSREDRNNFVNIIWANIDPSMQHNFNQQIADGDDLGAYDFGSVMHYPATAFSVNGQPTIVPRVSLPAGVTMGQRSGLSAGDIAGVAAMYAGIIATVKEVPKDPTIEPTIKELRKDPISDPTIKELRKDPVTDPTIKEIRKDPISDPTIKEVRKDPITDRLPTAKEAGFDPGPRPPFTLPPGRFGAGGLIRDGATPFVLASGNRYPGAPQADPLSAAAQEVQDLADAHSQAQQQADALAEAYEAAVATYEALLQQSGGA